ncbi:hypothetical protein V8C35DRAFT_298254 [Trichoderma chlorosporum]
MDPLLPHIDLVMDPSWYWFHDKFGLQPEDLFTTLHDRFNTKKFPLQDPESFHLDVCECADAAETREEFYSKLSTRMTERTEQMTKAWEDISTWLSAFPNNMFCQLCFDEETLQVKLKLNSLNDNIGERGVAFDKFSRTMSVDSLVRFFDGFTRDERKRQDDESLRQKESRKYWEKYWENEHAARYLGRDNPPSCHRAASNTPEPSRDASTMNSPAPAATMNDKANPTRPSRRRGPDQPEALAQTRTTKSLTRKRSDEGDENAKEPQEKKRRLISAGEVDADRNVGPEKQGAAEVLSALGRAEKRKRVDEEDDFQNDARKKQPRTTQDPIPDFTQLPEWAGTELNEFAQDIITTGATSPPEIPVPHRDDPDMTDEECAQRELGRSEPNSSVSTGNNLSFAIPQPSPNEDTGSRYGFTSKINTISPGTRSPDRVAQPSRRHYKRQTCREQKTPTPKKQTRQRKPRKRNASPLVQQILQSSRSSRRGPAQKLLFLNDNGTTCAVVAKTRN